MKINNNLTGNSGTYVSAKLSSKSTSKIIKFLEGTKPPFSLDYFVDEAHLTIMYSKELVISNTDLKVDEDLISIPIKFEYWDGHDAKGYVVLKLVSNPATNLHKQLLDKGASHSFDVYSPHVTICKDVLDQDVDKQQALDWIQEVNKKINDIAILVSFDMINIEDCK